MWKLSLLLAFVAIGMSHAWAVDSSNSQTLGGDVKQLLVSIAPDWKSSKGGMMAFERRADGTWKPSLKPVQVLFGRHGLAWGRGVLVDSSSDLRKVEKDGRAPTGVFRIGTVYTHDPALPEGADYPFHKISTLDAWIDDPTLPEYNRFVRIDPKNPPPWFEKQKMRHNDFAYRWLVEIRHNADPPVAGMGSAIFFHIRRGENKPTAGCTTMAEEDLVSVIRWLRAPAKPHYVLLPWEEYQTRWKVWGLPNPEMLAKITPK
jgi:L,D-peptidoglycan transpeptidase YkuD (ErfK/YbiS/YcfS/YnhG family)